MTVTNRKMFKRDARDKVRQMGGIMASSEPLMQEVARFQPGGSVDTRDYFQSLMKSSKFGGGQQLSEETLDFLEKRFGKQMPSYNKNVDIGVDSDTNFILGKDKGTGLGGIPFIRAPQQNVNLASRRKEVPMLIAEREQLAQQQKLRKILGLAEKAGFKLDAPVRNKEEVLDFIKSVDPTFNLTAKAYEKLFGGDPNVARKTGTTIGNFMKSLLVVPTATTLDSAKGIGQALFGETKAYSKDELRGLISGQMKTEPGVKIDLANAALDLYQREITGAFARNPEEVAQEIKNISGFDVKAMSAMKMRKTEDPSGILGVLTGEGSGMQVTDPKGFMGAERAGQPPRSLTAADSERLREQERRLQQADFREAEDALLQSRGISDPQSSQGADIQAILQGLESKFKPPPDETGEPSKGLGVDFQTGQRAKIDDAVKKAAEVEGDPLTEAQSTAEQIDKLEKVSQESEESLNNKNLEKPKETYGDFGKNIGSGSIDSNQGAKDARLKQLIKEFTDNAPKYEGLDSGLAIAKIGFMMAAGESPNAIVNISNALNKGADMFMADDAKKKEFTRQVELSGLQYGLGEIGKIREDERARARFLFEKNYDLEYFTVKDVDDDGNETFRSVALSKKFIAENGLPDNVMNSDLTGKYMTLQAAIAKSTNDDLDAVRLKGKDIPKIDEFRQGLTTNVTNVISATNSIDLLKRFIEYNEDGQVVGVANGLETAWGRALTAAGFTPDKKYTDREKAIADVAQVFQSLIPLTLGKDQSANSISNFDVERLAKAYVGINIDSKNPFALSFTAQAFITSQMQRQIRLFEREQEKNIRDINSKITNEGLVFFYGAGKDLRPLISVGEEQLRRLQPYIDPDSDLGLGGLGVSGITGPILDFDSNTNLYSLAKRT